MFMNQPNLNTLPWRATHQGNGTWQNLETIFTLEVAQVLLEFPHVHSVLPMPVKNSTLYQLKIQNSREIQRHSLVKRKSNQSPTPFYLELETKSLVLEPQGATFVLQCSSSGLSPMPVVLKPI